VSTWVCPASKNMSIIFADTSESTVPEDLAQPKVMVPRMTETPVGDMVAFVLLLKRLLAMALRRERVEKVAEVVDREEGPEAEEKVPRGADRR
jgi:hypothetical protein